MTPRLIAALAAAALLASACSAEPAEPPRAQATPSAPSSSPPPPPPPPQPSLLSGRLGKPNGPVYAVKIDNTAAAHPQVGLTKADVVYVEQVEGGVTRLAAIYSSELPRYVGPVRSARVSDLELLRQYGTVGLIYSGAQRKLIRRLKRAPLKLVSFDDSRRGYTRSGARPKPYDVIGTVPTLVRRAGAVSRPTVPGYGFGPAPLGGRPAARFTARYPGARVSGVWSASQARWLLSMDGRKAMSTEAGQLGPTTFVVQFVTITGSAYKDVNGAVTPNSRTVGSGKAMVFRDGQVFDARWSRPRASAPTAYTIAGQPAVFAPGQVWVALLGTGRPVTVG